MNRHTNVIQSFGSALRGCRYGLNGRNLKIQIWVGVLVLAPALWLPTTAAERVILLTCILAVLAFEFLNTAVEELSDVLIKEHHPGIAKVKELAAAAVMTISLATTTVGLYIFLPYLKIF